MDHSLYKEIEYLISRELVEAVPLTINNTDFAIVASTKLKAIFSSCRPNYDEETYHAIAKTVNDFTDENEMQKRKLYSFCFDFFDPTEQPQTISQNGEEIQLNTYLQEDDLYKLYQFVKRHESDNTFGSTVYKVMDKHQLTAPQVYKAALLRRQDFSRATDPKAKNVSKLIAWQIIIGLQCNMDEADEVLFSAGYIRRKSKFDLTMEYFIKHQNYDIMAINEVLDELKLKVFSCYKSVRDNDNQ